MSIDKTLKQFLEGKGKNKGRFPDERYASFDYCYNYFYAFYKQDKISLLYSPEFLEKSCLQLGFYLASWGMMRGSSFLLEKSMRNLSRVIELISRTDKRLWEIDVPSYNEENIDLLLSFKEELINAFGRENKPSDTLVTKIMLGVFANVPAYDQYFRKSFGVYSFNKKSLLKIKEFYDSHKKELDVTIKTLDFTTGKETKNTYTKAKIIDMYGFMKGAESLNQ